MKPIASLAGRTSPLSLRLLLVIVISSSLVTLIITAIQLALEYRSDVEHIELRLKELEMSYLDSVTRSLWNFNDQQYRIQLKGILSLQDVVYTEIRGPDGALIAAEGNPGERGSIVNRAVLAVNNFGDRLVIGELAIHASLERVYRNLLYRGLIILASQAVKTILVSTVIVLAFYYLVARHVRFIADYVRRLDVSSDDELQLERNANRRRDELDIVTEAINQMKRALRASYEHIRRLNVELESKVAARTRELERANHRLEERNRELAASHRQLSAQKERLDFLASRDSLLAPLYNRRRFDEALAQEWRDGLRRAEPLTLAMLDIDHFKPFNDHYGHQAGDEALRRVAAVLADAVHRPHDMAARYGGEEFMLLLPGTDADGAHRVAEGVRTAIEGLAVAHRASSAAPVLTVSIGCVCAVPRPDLAVHDFLRLADERLYRAKQAGRNCVVCGD
jgi:diguanylate cyclase (GGDEF)-like protein